MNIIFGDSIKYIPDSFTCLELDTFRVPGSEPMLSWCVVEKVPLNEYPLLDAHKIIHADLIRYYREQQWNYCEQAIQGLMGKWGGELDSFYTDLLQRVVHFKQHEPAEDWDYVLVKEL
jgi:hypothetical protein